MKITGMRFQHNGTILCRVVVKGKPRFYLGREKGKNSLLPSVGWIRHDYVWKRLAGGLVELDLRDEMDALANRMARNMERRWLFMEGSVL